MKNNQEPMSDSENEAFGVNYALVISIVLPVGLVAGIFLGPLLFESTAIGIGLGLGLAMAFAPLISVVMLQKNRKEILDSGEESATNNDKSPDVP